MPGGAAEMVQPVLALLERLGIRYQLARHAAVASCEEAARVVQGVPGVPSKSLLLKSKEGAFYLILAPCAKRLDLKWLARELGCGRLTFATAADLQTTLHLTPGSVSPFGLLSDRANAVQVVVDAEIFSPPVCQFHPNDNRATIALGTDDFKKFLAWSGHQPKIVRL